MNSISSQAPRTSDPQPTWEELDRLLADSTAEFDALLEECRNLELELQHLRRESAKARKIRNSASYRIGKLIVRTVARPYRIVLLPWGLYKIARFVLQRHRLRRAIRYLESEGYVVKRIRAADSSVSTAAGATESAIAAAYYRSTFESLLKLAEEIPGSNGSQYYKPIELRVGIVTDEFMLNYYRNIFSELTYLTPENFKQELESKPIDLFLFVTCWSGVSQDEWRGITYREKPKNALANILDHCRANQIPTVFQSIEDPSNFDHFLPVASRFDHILTTDSDCVASYRAKTPAKTVSFGEFGANPVFNNPIGSRRHRFNGGFFAGSYPSRYPERCRDMHTVFDSFLQSGADLVIADRNSDRPSEAFEFPRKYQPHIVPKVEHATLQKIHKVFAYNINFNSIKHSPTMCAMRIYELQAQGSMLLSNYARSVVNNFPGIDILNVRSDVKAYLRSANTFEFYERQMTAVREIMTSKTGFDQVHRMLDAIGLGARINAPKPIILIVVDDLSDGIREMAERQHYPHRKLQSRSEFAASSLIDADYVTFFSAANDYEPYYLVDMVNAFKYTKSRYITRAAYFDGPTFHDGAQHEFVDRVASVDRTLFVASEFSPQELIGMQPGTPCDGGYSIDPFELNCTRYYSLHHPPTTEYLMSVIIPVYNNGDFLRHKCLESLRRNEIFDRMELLLVDDGSTDPNTLQTLDLLQRRLSNVRVHRFSDQGSGSASRPRNTGVHLATAPLVTFLDPDNEISPEGYDNLYRIYSTLRSEGVEVDLVSGFQIKVGAAQNVTAKHSNQDITVFENPRLEVLIEKRFPIISTQAALIRKDFLIDCGVDFVKGAVGQDTLYGYELMAHAKRAAFTNSAHIIYYAERGTSVTNTIDTRFFEKSLTLERELHTRLKKIGLIDEYIETKFDDFFVGWYLEKLKLTNEQTRPTANQIVKQIAIVHGVDPEKFSTLEQD